MDSKYNFGGWIQASNNKLFLEDYCISLRTGDKIYFLKKCPGCLISHLQYVSEYNFNWFFKEKESQIKGAIFKRTAVVAST